MLSNRAFRRLASATSMGKFSMAGKQVFVRVAAIYDGDTLTVTARLPGSEKYYDYNVRLDGIDTPELSRVSRQDPDREIHMRAGAAARDKLAAKIPIGTILIFQGSQEADMYGRLLGTLFKPMWMWRRVGWVPGENINQWLIAQGLALSYDGGKKATFRTSFLRRIAAV